ncbi:MAG TPA: hypothetical protein DCL42_00270 [Deltaproteobacteria bacterium]|nr:MAG: hypothetical protein A2090_06180 [Deltaproteobacteria bacterium GWD2_42_10]OGP46712.1 MAG: hypothetical protein A2022_05305 [Deltaproteobacteria bacterium GWF2_42_12]OGQ30362.1 MAG: hypothetical protein A3D29_06270 [Deltaproteobacteria bacterium RIFCSPHIGHO2_02_FULL_42_44]OGQ38280.1 MAG: hypothetical protein A3H47_00145 [Deltaproteobacteria bacterium RIFCSPLOWO2_02_FULL_42_39]OGQ69395.1 MAG: hypothetical protein A3F88_00490 [Deltaproteobacteria bacterium RIFCSPLOWO2_12_FULL_42_16]OGQ75
MKKIFLVAIFIVIGNFSYARATEFGPFQGKILDAETKEPIEGVVVLIEWCQYRLSSLFENTIFYDAQETLTDKNGEFYISGIWIVNPWTRLMVVADVIIYKSGYGTVDGIDLHGPWKSFLEREWGAPKGTYILKVENGKPVIILEKVTDVEERRKNIPSEPSVPDGKYHQLKWKWKLLRLEKNKERKFLGLGELIDSDQFGR